MAPSGLQHVHTPSPGGQTRFISAFVRALPLITYRNELNCLFNTFIQVFDYGPPNVSHSVSFTFELWLRPTLKRGGA